MKQTDWNRTQLEPGLTEFVAEVHVFEAGEFYREITLFANDRGARAITFTVHGTASAAPAFPEKMNP